MEVNLLHARTQDHIYTGSRYSRMLFAEVLQRVCRYPGGLEVSKRILEHPVLRPVKSKEDGKMHLKPTILRAVVRRALPRFNARLRKVAIREFMECDYRVYGIGTRRRVGGRDDVLVWSPADAKKCQILHWYMEAEVGRVCMMAALHALVAKIKALAMIYVKETETETAHYRVRYEVYANVAAKVRHFCLQSGPSLMSVASLVCPRRRSGIPAKPI